ncbi:unnamed protein product [Darwinula stevensoni]|uniref:MARVEL domain-containing protein n=1 Tax=Darwinula stevensoni TaxID=69355 RepID=A0A7R8X548_9CRUS|nr:unnamed protein product [Darwinula stevensoni]CAG0886762.1 unnamed protein product [Darwinula stevensoni]
MLLIMEVNGLVFAIAAFATVTNFSGDFSIKVTCPTNSSDVSLHVNYPFSLAHEQQSVSVCGAPKMAKFHVNVASDARFFVATGVLSMLWAMAALFIYLFMDDLYQNDKKTPLADFVGTLILATFWLAGSSAWANGLSMLKHGTSPDNYAKAFCHTNGYDEHTKCSGLTSVQYAPLTISVILGFLNFVLWGGNLWFLYKETPWFKNQEQANPDTAVA